MFQNHIAVISANQAYGEGTEQIGDLPAKILALDALMAEAFITSEVDLHVRRSGDPAEISSSAARIYMRRSPNRLPRQRHSRF